jgi:hypothetical protein
MLSHLCNWHCHWNFDFDNCPLLCGDHCVHPDCNNRHCPDLYPPPNDLRIPCPIPPSVVHHIPLCPRPGNTSPVTLTSLPFLQWSPQFSPASLAFLNQSVSIDPHPYGLLQSYLSHIPCPCRSYPLLTYTDPDRVNRAH